MARVRDHAAGRTINLSRLVESQGVDSATQQWWQLRQLPDISQLEQEGLSLAGGYHPCCAAPVMELAYMMVSNTIAERRVGSNPTGGTKVVSFEPSTR